MIKHSVISSSLAERKMGSQEKHVSDVPYGNIVIVITFIFQ